MRIVPFSLPTPYPVGPVNAYLLPGPPVTLVDCGPKTDQALAALRDGLLRAGRDLEKVERLIITHGHVDHFGLAATVAAVSGAAIYAHQAEVPKMNADRAFIEPMRDVLTEAGFDPSVGDTLLEALRRYREQFDTIVPHYLLGDGDRLPLAERTLTVLHTPGHAQGHICLWDGGALISGDLLLEEISPNPIIEFDPNGGRLRTLPALLQSLRRVEALAPAVAYPGHGEIIVGPAPRARELLRHHAERRERLAALLAGRFWTLRELAANWYPDLDRFNLFLGLSEVLGHLDLLEDDGRLTVERRGGVLHYTLRIAPDGA